MRRIRHQPVLAAAIAVTFGLGLWAAPVVRDGDDHVGSRAAAQGGAGAEGWDATAPMSTPTNAIVGASATAGEDAIVPAGFEAHDSCGDVVESFRAALLDAVGPFGLPARPFDRLNQPEAASAASGRGDAASSPEGSTGQTNTVVDGVDEADLIEVDGDVMYALVGGGRVVDIVDLSGDQRRALMVTDPQPTTLASVELALGRIGTGLMKVGDRLVVSGTDLTGTLDSFIEIIDVTDPARPVPLTAHEMSGMLVGTRSAAGQVQFVTRELVGVDLPFVQPVDAGNDAALTLATDVNRATVAEADLDDVVGHHRVIDLRSGDSRRQALGGCHDTLVGDARAPWRVTVGAIDPESPDILRASSVIGAVDRVLVTNDQSFVVGLNPDLSSTVIQFATHADGAPRPVASGRIRGQVRNDFDLNEHEDRLRVVSTEGVATHLTVLERVGDDLVEVGAVGDIAPGEQSFGVRFLGDWAYVVTFRVFDPLHVIDLRDPRNPRLRGELEVPGVSLYLHPIAPDRLLGIGRTEDFRAEVSVFDVSDPDHPKRISHLVRDGGGGAIPRPDHHAYAVSEDGLVTIALTDGIGWVVRYANGALTEVGQVHHGNHDLTPLGYIERLARTDDIIWSMSPAGLMGSALDQLDEVAWHEWSVTLRLDDPPERPAESNPSA
ncbi:MAG TPA: beta-propeller domain-containing protein [Acidimicrobiales bacterium]|jgi:hypothetical protein